MIMCVLLCYPVSIRIYYQQGVLFLVYRGLLHPYGWGFYYTECHTRSDRTIASTVRSSDNSRASSLWFRGLLVTENPLAHSGEVPRAQPKELAEDQRW